jgi:hypothetical protein
MWCRAFSYNVALSEQIASARPYPAGMKEFQVYLLNRNTSKDSESPSLDILANLAQVIDLLIL